MLECFNRLFTSTELSEMSTKKYLGRADSSGYEVIGKNFIKKVKENHDRFDVFDILT